MSPRLWNCGSRPVWVFLVSSDSCSDIPVHLDVGPLYLHYFFFPLAVPPGVSGPCPSQPCTPRTFLGLFSDFFLQCHWLHAAGHTLSSLGGCWVWYPSAFLFPTWACSTAAFSSNSDDAWYFHLPPVRCIFGSPLRRPLFPWTGSQGCAIPCSFLPHPIVLKNTLLIHVFKPSLDGLGIACTKA